MTAHRARPATTHSGIASRARQALACALLLGLAACGGGGGGASEDSAPAATAPEPVALRLTELATDLASPWGLAFLPDGRMLVTERQGRLKLLRPDGRLEAEITGLPAVDARGQGGLLGLALDPAFASNRRVYFGFAEADPAQPGANGTAVARAVLPAGGTRLEAWW